MVIKEIIGLSPYDRCIDLFQFLILNWNYFSNPLLINPYLFPLISTFQTQPTRQTIPSQQINTYKMQLRHQALQQNQKLYQEIKFLQTQNHRLKDELSDAKQMIQMNKIEIDVLSKNKSHDKKLIDIIYNYRQLIQTLQQKNATLYQNYKKLSTEKLFIEQLNQELHSEQKSIEELQKNRTQELADVIKGLEQKINHCQKNHQSYDGITGFVEKNRDLFTPSQQAIEFRNKENAWAQEIAYLKDELNQHKNNEENLLLANGVLRNKVVSLQAKLAMPNKNLGEILDKSLKRLMLYFIETQKKMLTGDDSDSEQQDLQLIAPELIELFPHRQLNSASDIKVPALNILKVRTQQMKGNEKIEEELIKRNHLSKDEKIQRFKVELQFTRRSLTKNMIDLKSEKQRRKILQRICEDLQARNEILLKSNQNYKKKIEKIKKDSQNSKTELVQKADLLDDDAELNISRNLKESRRPLDQHKARQYEVNKYLQKVETPFEYKLHLQLLAKELSKNPKLKSIKQKKMIKAVDASDSAANKLKRSTSNPFLYFNQRRDQILQVKPHNDMIADDPVSNPRLEQTQFLIMGQNKNINFDQDLKDPDDY